MIIYNQFTGNDYLADPIDVARLKKEMSACFHFFLIKVLVQKTKLLNNYY
jgi:hypothetical protein